MKAFRLISLLFISMLFASHAVTQESEPATDAEEAAPVSTATEMSSEEASEGTSADQTVSEQTDPEDQPETIMDEPLDGSSVESFSKGLEKLDEEASEEEYRSVMSALSFLLFYDIAANRDRAKLYSRLDGKTPNEILERVENHRKGKRKNRQ